MQLIIKKKKRFIINDKNILNIKYFEYFKYFRAIIIT